MAEPGTGVNQAASPAAHAARTYVPLLRERFRGEARSQFNGGPTDLFTLTNQHGMVVNFTNLGAKILQIIVPDRDGVMDDVALGYDSIESVLSGQASMGAFIGR